VKLFLHTADAGSNNCYLVGSEFDAPQTAGQIAVEASDQPKVAFIIDPGHIDQSIINFIEENDYTLKAVLLTHDHLNHTKGIKTLMRIYDLDVYAGNPVVFGKKTTMVRDGDIITIGPFSIEIISVPGHALDSVIYKVEHFLFTGDSLSAGLVGKTSSSYGARLQINALQRSILSLPGDYAILPGHGPPSSLQAERRFNAGILLHEHKKSRRPMFNLDL
jgi:glyoxylase-like metal-dependent hydrolase (beta-lactamase superfamily II)